MLITLTHRKPECFHIPQQVSFQRVWLDSSKMSGRTGAAVVAAAVNGWAVKVKVRPATPAQSWRNGFTFPNGPSMFLCFLFHSHQVVRGFKRHRSVRGFTSLQLCCLKQLVSFAAFLWLWPVQEQKGASAAQLKTFLRLNKLFNDTFFWIKAPFPEFCSH